MYARSDVEPLAAQKTSRYSLSFCEREYSIRIVNRLYLYLENSFLLTSMKVLRGKTFAKRTESPLPFEAEGRRFCLPRHALTSYVYRGPGLSRGILSKNSVRVLAE